MATMILLANAEHSVLQDLAKAILVGQQGLSSLLTDLLSTVSSLVQEALFGLLVFVVGCVLLYTIVRLCSAAILKSLAEHNERGNSNGEEN